MSVRQALSGRTAAGLQVGSSRIAGCHLSESDGLSVHAFELLHSVADFVAPDNSTLTGIIFGTPGCGVTNDFHQSAFFVHLAGRKVWLFTEKSVTATGSSTSLCSYRGLFEDHRVAGQVCVLQPNEFLFAPAGLYHSTCHLDDTVTMLQITQELPSTIASRDPDSAPQLKSTLNNGQAATDAAAADVASVARSNK